MRLVNDIRNLFAHEFRGEEWTFDRPEIQKKCDALIFVKKAAPPLVGQPMNNRGKFVATIYFLAGQIHGEILVNSQRKLTSKFLT